MNKFNKKDPSGTLETKRFNLSECKLAPSDSATEAMQFSGYGAVFGNIDCYGDTIDKKAFDAYLADVEAGKQDPPAMLMQHGGWGLEMDSFTPVGVYTEIKSDDFGLKTVGNLAPTARGNEAYALMKMQPRPALSGLSIGYYVRDSENGGKNDQFQRKLTQIDLVEISIVTFPANGLARINRVKSTDEFNERTFEQILRELGFSKKEALCVISKGFRHLLGEREAGNKELEQQLKQIDALRHLSSQIYGAKQ